MSVELFLKLKEIDSLTKMKNSFTKTKNEQEDRLSKLNVRRQEALLQTAKLKQTLIEANSALADVESKIKTHSEQKQRLIDIGGDEKKISTYEEEIGLWESKGFELLSQIEQIDTELADNRTFLEGLEKTITEIEGDVRSEVDKINLEIKNIDLRIQLLMEELPPEFRTILVKTSAKNLAHGPFTRVEQGSCYFCRFKISRIDESEVDMQRNLKTCPQCSRIFLPYGS